VSSAPPPTGRLFDGRYRIERPIGHGGMARVYLAEDTSLHRPVAIKVLDSRHADDDQFVERFAREARAAAGLNHPNIVSIYDRGSAGGAYYIVMEYVEGRTLKDVIEQEGPLAPRRSVDLVLQLLAGLRQAHQRGVIHRDVKPHNVIVQPDGRLKVMDFGIARAQGRGDMTEAGSIVGTAQYLAPEQARGLAVGPPADLYATGVVLYEMLTGKVPFTGASSVAIAMKQVQEEPVPPSRLNPAVPPDLEKIVLRALVKDPEKRYQTADQMGRDLDRFRKGEEIAPATAATSATMAIPRVADTGVTRVERPPGPPGPRVPPAAYREPAHVPPDRFDDDDDEALGGGSNGRLWGLIALIVLLIAGVAVALVISGAFSGGSGSSSTTTTSSTLTTASTTAASTTAATTVAFPDGVIGQPLAAAKAALADSGLKAGTETDGTSTTVPKGSVISASSGGADVQPGTQVSRGSTVDLVVSTGGAPVAAAALLASVKGKTPAEATALIEAANLKVAAGDPAQVFSDEVDSGSVVDFTPSTGLREGDTVALEVSKGSNQVAVPEVSGARGEIQRTIRAAGLRSDVQTITSSQPTGTILSVSPDPGTSVDKGSTVTVVVSSGPARVTVPAVVGLSEADAKAKLTEQGLTYNTDQQQTSDPGQVGIVISQDPGPGGKASKGDPVTIVVGTEAPATNPTTAATTGT
jgi:eukaryotic-like serine/threonine-protein kinase